MQRMTAIRTWVSVAFLDFQVKECIAAANDDNLRFFSQHLFVTGFIFFILNLS